MHWRDTLRETWRGLPPGKRRQAYLILILATGMLVLSFVLPPERQLWAVGGLFALFVVLQVAILWQMWRQRPAIRNAQRCFKAGDYAGVVTLLEPEYLGDSGDATGYTLLGNAYRQLGRLEESVRVLEAAQAAAPDLPFVAYGLGRTLLVMGRFAEAAGQIAHAVEHGGLAVIQLELALAHHYAGDQAAAAAALQRAAGLEMEPHRMLMSAYLRGKVGGADPEETRLRLERHAAGLAFWQAEAELFAQTPYGAALARDVAAIAAQIRDRKSVV